MNNLNSVNIVVILTFVFDQVQGECRYKNVKKNPEDIMKL